MATSPVDSIEDYLQQSYRDEKRELERVRHILEDMWPVFTHSHTLKGWAYELQDGEIKKEPEDFSSSTNAMILFAMGLGLGWIRCGSLAVITPQPIEPGDIDEQKRVFVEGFEQLIKKANAQLPIFKSGSFGDDDPLTLSWVLDLLANAATFENYFDPEKLSGFQTRVSEAARQTVKKAFTNPGESCLRWTNGSGKNPLDHTFPLLRAIQVYWSLEKLLSKPIYDELERLAQEKVRPFLLNRLHLHLSLATLPNSDFDAAELVFALEGLLLVDPRSRTLESTLLVKCFEVMEETQKRSPYWRPLKPFVTTQTGMALLPLSVEIANSLLRICKRLEANESGDKYFTKYNALFTRYSDWLFRRVASLRDLDGKELIGWHSEHVRAPKKIHPWETAQVAIFFLNYADMLQDHIARTSLAKANFSISTLPRKKDRNGLTPAQYWKQEWEIKEPLTELPEPSKYRIFRRIREKFIEGQQEDKHEKDASGYFSMLLYGPPGTGKTTIAQELAKAFKWRLVTITPSDFIAKGEAEVEARAKAIFHTLQEQKHLIILFDEIDRMILDRDCQLYRAQSDIFQFMTPSMLVKIKDLRETKRTIFLIATNYEERIDPAIKRVGRIDEKFLVCPADRLQRNLILKLLLGEYLRKAIKNKTGWDPLKNAIDSESFETIIAGSVLYSYGELKNLVKEAIANLGKAKFPDIAELKEKLLYSMNKLGSSVIALSNYRSRFNLDNVRDFGTVQKPYEEFLMLCYLKIQNQTFSREDYGLAERIIDAGIKESNPNVGAVSPKNRIDFVNRMILEEKVTDGLNRKLENPPQ